MKTEVKNNRIAEIRLVEAGDRDLLFSYLQQLSPESRSRFGPHPFDRPTIQAIFDQADASLHRYIALDEDTGSIVAYMLIRQGMIEADQQRYAERSQFFRYQYYRYVCPICCRCLAKQRPGHGYGSLY